MAATILLAICFPAIFLFSLVLFFLFPFLSRGNNKQKLLQEWPVLGMLPSLVANFNDLLGWGTSLFNHLGVTTIMIKTPWLSKPNQLVTVDPANLHYISSTRFANFSRVPKHSEIFDVFGNGLFNSEGDEWQAHRKIIKSFFGHKQFKEFSNGVVFEKVKEDMVVVLDHLASVGRLGGGDEGVVDLEELFSRYTYDLTHKLIIGSDPKSLSLQWPQVPYTNAMNNAMESIWMRFLIPEPIWKFQRRVGVGQEKLLHKAKIILNRFADTVVSTKHDEINSQSSKFKENYKYGDMLTAYLMGDERYLSGEDDKALKNTLLSLMLGGKDSTASALVWLFWNLSQNPKVEAKIRDEIAGLLSEEDRVKAHMVTEEEVSRLVYLHAVVFETLRLYPPFPFHTRVPVEPDVLPSGHIVSPNSTLIVIPLYVMARVEAVWGKDCVQFKPERWITSDGEFIHQPSYKFFTFNSGMRICPGKELALIETKVVIANIVYNYNVQILEKQDVVPLYSSVLQTKYGLNARISNRFV